MKRTISALCMLLALCAFIKPNSAAPDTTFMEKAAQGNIAEINAANMALQKSTSDSVKAFAQMMIDDHTKALTDLKALASSKGVQLPDSTDELHKTAAKQLSMLQGAEFDKTYLQGQVRDHQATIALFQEEAGHGEDAQTKAFAAKTLPTLMMHLEHVTAITKKMQM